MPNFRRLPWLISAFIMTLVAEFPALAVPSALVVPPAQQFVTHHQVVIGGQKIAFTATAGETYLYDLSGNPTASFFSFAYVKDHTAANERPVLFVFGGGPGSASHFLNIGLLGPWRLAPDRLAPDHPSNSSNLPPFDLVDNSASVLDVADLVFIDPVGTGFSRAIGAGKPEDFWSVAADADSVAQFIQLWLSSNGRWNSPKFVLGESYGSIRAAIISKFLMGNPYGNGVLRGVTLNGVILLATAIGSMDPAESPQAGSELSVALSLPAEAATAWYHNKINRGGRSLADLDAEVTHFAMTDYVEALRKAAQGTLSPAERAAIVAKLVAYTGLPPEAFAKDLAVARPDFTKQVLADRGLDVGAYDGRFTTSSSVTATDPVADDPALSRSFPAWSAAFEELLHDKLKVSLERPYTFILWRDLLAHWDFKPPTVPYAVELADSMRRVAQMRVLVTSGYFDLVTTAAHTRYALDQAHVPTDRLTFKIYEGGHDLYAGRAADPLAADIRTLIRAASSH